MAQRNAERNGLTNMDFLCEDTFELLPRLEKEGHPYDFIILDPPAFTKARRTVENAMRGYKEINYRAMKLLPRGGYLATASCSHFARPFVRVMLSIRPYFSVSVLALSVTSGDSSPKGGAFARNSHTIRAILQKIGSQFVQNRQICLLRFSPRSAIIIA